MFQRLMPSAFVLVICSETTDITTINRVMPHILLTHCLIQAKYGLGFKRHQTFPKRRDVNGI